VDLAEKTRLLLENAREGSYFSAYQVYAQMPGRHWQWAGGISNYWPPSVPVDAHTLFDIGSITKVVVTTSLFALAFDRHQVKLDSKLSDFLPELRSNPVGSALISDLLCHASGLKGWLPIYKDQVGDRRFRSYLVQECASWIEKPAGKQAIYSDLGFMLLGEALTEIFKVDLNAVFQREIVAPLKLRHVEFGPIAPPRAVAATEVRNGAPLLGVVFDENSESVGGVSGHAGLFATAENLAPWCQEWLKALEGKSAWLTQETAQLFVKRVGKVPASTWALGWDTKSEQGSSAGSLFSPTSFGHLGYTGCSVWIDPEKKAFVIFLSNRVHPSRLDERIRVLRPALHDSIGELWARS